MGRTVVIAEKPSVGRALAHTTLPKAGTNILPMPAVTNGH